MGAVRVHRAVAANTKSGILLLPIQQSSHRCGIGSSLLLWGFPFLPLGHRIRKVLADTDQSGHIATSLAPRRVNPIWHLDCLGVKTQNPMKSKDQHWMDKQARHGRPYYPTHAEQEQPRRQCADLEGAKAMLKCAIRCCGLWISSPVLHEYRFNVSKPFPSQIHFLAVGSSAVTVVLGTVIVFMLYLSPILCCFVSSLPLSSDASQKLRTIAILGSRQIRCDYASCLLSDPPQRLCPAVIV